MDQRTICLHIHRTRISILVYGECSSRANTTVSVFAFFFCFDATKLTFIQLIQFGSLICNTSIDDIDVYLHFANNLTIAK